MIGYDLRNSEEAASLHARKTEHEKLIDLLFLGIMAPHFGAANSISSSPSSLMIDVALVPFDEELVQPSLAPIIITPTFRPGPH